MSTDASSEATSFLQAAAQGDREAAEKLLPVVYEDLRKLARARMARMAPGHTLQPTALVHEAFMRLVGKDQDWDGRGHFFAAAAQVMRDILIEQARRRATLKRGGNRQRFELEDVELQVQAPAEHVLAVGEAVERLEADDPRKGQIVNLRYFVGMTVEETAAALDLSVKTVEREWRYIRAWLKTQLENRQFDEKTGSP